MDERLIIDNPEELLRLQGISKTDVMKKVITEFGTKAWDQFLDDITRKRDLKNISPMSRQEVMNDPAMVQKIMEIGLMPEAGILGGVKGAKALGKLIEGTETPFKKAIMAIKEGADPEKVWKETGWTKDPSGKWMFRIDDSGMRINQEVFDVATTNDEVVKLGDLIEHKVLFNAYPSLKEIKVHFKKSGKSSSYSHIEKRIDIGTTNYVDSSILHEINHAVAQREGLVKGGVSPSSVAEYAPVWDDVKKQWTHPSFEKARKEYTNTAGEIYAREEAAGYKGMPGTMEKIPRKNWIVRKGMAEISRKRK